MFESLFANQLEWRQPLWLWLLLVPVVWALLQNLMRRQQKQSYADKKLWPWVAAEGSLLQAAASTQNSANLGQKLIWKVLRLLLWWLRPSRLLALAWICIIIALSGPRSLDNQFDIQNRHGVDVMISMDLSQSMLAEDVRPSRFLFAKSLVESLTAKLESHDRIGLSVFAGQPHAVVPLTHDKAVFKRGLNLIEPGLLPTKGSWLELALIHDLNLMAQTASAAKVLVVFTDGAPLFWKPQDLPQVIQDLPAAKSQRQSDTGVKVIYVGMGLTNNSTIPDKTDDSGKLHADGLLVQSRLEKNQLMKLAQTTEGDYLQAQAGSDFLNKLSDLVLQTAGEYQQKTPQQVWRDHSYPFLVAAVISLLLAFYLWSLMTAVAKASVTKLKSSANKVATGLAVAVLLPVVAMVSEPLQAAENRQVTLQQAYDAFQAQSYELAESLYDAQPDYQGWFGAGSSAYKKGDLEAAVLYFRQAAWQAPDDILRAKALYNLGNSYYLANLLPQAIEAFQQALKYQQPYNKAEHNLALALYRQKLEQEGKLKPKKDKNGDEDKGGSGQDNEGAFYGGQKPNSSNSDSAGVGSDGDGDDGEKQGNKVQIPDAEKLTDYRLNPSIAKLRLNSQQQDAQVNSVLRAQQNQQKAEQLEHELQKLQEDQKVLLKRLFEREEGFQAAQEKAHPIPGVQPW